MAKVLGARVHGIDCSRSGVTASRALFKALQIDGDLRCEDAFDSKAQEGRFDLVYSVGLVEHFDDPRDIVPATFYWRGPLIAPARAAEQTR